jgi:hypothetical protein
MLFPARWFVLVIRGCFLRGSDLSQLAVPLLAMLFMACLFVTVAVRKFKKDVEP